MAPVSFIQPSVPSALEHYPPGMSFGPKDLDRGLRATLWPALKAHGFSQRTERVAWRYAGDDVDVVELQAVGQSAEAVGCPPLSLSVHAAVYPRFLERTEAIPVRDGRLRPHYWHCHPFSRSLPKRVSQPWFRPFTGSRHRRTLPSLVAHRDALRTLVDRRVHDVPEIWYMRDDGTNLDENLHDLTAVVLSDGLDFTEQFHDPGGILALIENGSFVEPTSALAYRLREAIDAYVPEVDER